MRLMKRLLLYGVVGDNNYKQSLLDEESMPNVWPAY